MAENILRLKVDSNEYDSKLKRATQGLQSLEDKVRGMGATFEYAEKADVDFVAALGKMETKARGTKGRLAELANSIQDLSAQYNRLTESEKKSPYGKALNQSIGQLTTRYKDMKAQMTEVSRSMGEQQSGLQALTGKLGINISTLSSWGVALAAGKAALDVMKGAIQGSETTADLYASTISIAKSATDQFFYSLSTGDFTTFQNGIDGIVARARTAYEAMDELSSYAARFTPWQQAKETEVNTKLQQARAAKAQGNTGKASALVGEANALIDQLSSSTKSYGAMQTKAGYDTIRKLIGGNYSDQEIAYLANPANWSAIKADAAQWVDPTKIVAGRKWGDTHSNSYSSELAHRFMTIRDSGDKGEEFNQALTNIYGTIMAEARIEALRARADRMDGVVAGAARSSGSAAASGKKFKSMPQTVAGSEWLGLDPLKRSLPGLSAQGKIEGFDIIIDEVAAQQSQNLTAANDALKDAVENTKNWGTALGAVGSTFDSIGEIIGGTAGEYVGWIGNTISALGTLLSSEWAKMIITNGSLPFPENLVAIASTVGAVTTAIASMPKFAEGGVIGGSMYGGDIQHIRANAGEMIINQTDQRRLYDALHSGSLASGSGASTTISGEQLVTVINAYGRRTGRGEILQ